MDDLRIVRKMTDNGFVEVPFMELKQGDQFELLEDEELVVSDNGQTRFTATSDAYRNAEGIGTVMVDTEAQT